MNSARIISECQTLMSLVPKLHWLRINTLQILLNHIEDVVDYSFLTKATERPPIYASHDPHVKRANQISRLLNGPFPWPKLAALNGTSYEFKRT